MVLKVQLLHLTSLDSGHSLASVYSDPAEGTHMEQFQKTVEIYMKMKLGDGDHASVVDNIMDIADVNTDGKVGWVEDQSDWKGGTCLTRFIIIIITSLLLLVTLFSFV